MPRRRKHRNTPQPVIHAVLGAVLSGLTRAVATWLLDHLHL
ncbi:hypothetical protein [Kutzneria buriramensis]|uniref:Uncharacterized protein n=1 Tax=Kutzneria buriramensis TaxID=1045776 RepID=A0A3E0GT62_9PSEU|nr:hypothetical protein [Kutzneria buriramensis]REH25973.1 hypothetical protein BCF44_13512 [Kutzneria buriramensis]